MIKPWFKFLSLWCLALVFSCTIAPCASVSQQKNSAKSSAESKQKQFLLNVRVTNEKSKLDLKGIGKNAFTVFVGDKPQEVTFFGGQDLPLSIGILLDTSGSMGFSKKRANLLKEVVAKFIRENNSANEYFVMGFKNKAQLLVDWTKDIDAITAVIQDVQQSFAGTAIYDTCHEAIEKLMSRPNLRRAILLITDGQDTASKHKNRDLFALVKQTDVIIYSLCLSDPALDALVESGIADLATLSSISGGKVRSTSQLEVLQAAAEAFALELRHQYLIGFTPTNLEPKWHRVKVKVLPVLIKNSTQGKPIEPLVETRQGFSWQ